LLDGLPQTLTEAFIESLRQLDRPKMMKDMYHVGKLAAEQQVTPDDFPPHFNIDAMVPSPAA
jgi:hypothetical protein